MCISHLLWGYNNQKGSFWNLRCRFTCALQTHWLNIWFFLLPTGKLAFVLSNDSLITPWMIYCRSRLDLTVRKQTFSRFSTINFVSKANVACMLLYFAIFVAVPSENVAFLSVLLGLDIRSKAIIIIFFQFVVYVCVSVCLCVSGEGVFSLLPQSFEFP